MTHKMISNPLYRKAMAKALWQARGWRSFSKAEFSAACFAIQSAFWELTKMDAGLL